PMMFAHSGTRTIVANEADQEGLLERQGSVWVGRLPQSINVANAAVTVGGKRWSMVMWPVADNRYSRGRLMMHESFHRIQDELGLPSSNPSNSHLATADARILMRLEWRALAEALLRSGAERKQALEDALTFRARRVAASANAADEERQLEMNEGLAEYTGFVLSGLPASALFDRVAVQLGQYEQQESFVRGFAYASGPAYALLLDAAAIPWRQGLGSGADLGAMAAAAYGITAVSPDYADSLVSRYSGARLIAEERARESRRIASEAKLRARFIDGPVLTLPVAGKFSFSFDPNGAAVLPGAGIVYESSRIADEWGVLEVSSGGVLFLRREDGAFTGMVVAEPSATEGEVRGAGWKLALAAGWSVEPRAGSDGSFRLVPATR
ncbi:MAG: hypothetical protein ACSLFK_06110, partial [Gemmatimonadaceae bacterium]